LASQTQNKYSPSPRKFHISPFILRRVRVIGAKIIDKKIPQNQASLPTCFFGEISVITSRSPLLRQPVKYLNDDENDTVFVPWETGAKIIRV
jgi:hypothetical protein